MRPHSSPRLQLQTTTTPHSFLPRLLEAEGDAGHFESMLQESMLALYHQRCRLVGTASTNVAQEAEIRADAKRVRGMGVMSAWWGVMCFGLGR